MSYLKLKSYAFVLLSVKALDVRRATDERLELGVGIDLGNHFVTHDTSIDM